jgi:arabinofuranosyltransferase
LPRTSVVAVRTQPKSSQRVAPAWAVLGLPALVYAIAILRVAWISDDAFISGRAALNAASGLGLLLNPPERVLGFTNPLWTLLLVPLSLARLPTYWALMALALGTSLAFGAVLAWRGRLQPAPFAAALWLASFSLAFTQFSVSGLENPLSHLLLTLFCFEYLRQGDRPGERPRWIWFLVGLIGATRLDLLLLVIPSCFWLILGRRRLPLREHLRRVLPGRLKPAALGLLPLGAWELFAIVYYGFPLPNTAFAKLTTSIPGWDLVRQGLWYLADSLTRDPITLLVILASIGLLIAGRRARDIALALGVGCYFLFLLRAGGDFMAGRFLTPPFAVALVALAVNSGAFFATLPRAAFAPALVLFVLFPGPFGDVERYECRKPPSGIVDERKCYAEHTALADNLRIQKYRTHVYWKIGEGIRASGQRVHVSQLVGMTALAAGPRVHLIDEYALTDPLLGRIPYEPEPGWRIGHFRRPIPDGYVETIATGEHRLQNACLRAYYQRLSSVVHGPLFSAPRWRAIVLLNTGQLDHLVQPGCVRP